MTDFKITGPGEYRTRDGRKATVTKEGARFLVFCFEGYADGRLCRWSENGFVRLSVRDKDDIIGQWEEQATVSPVLTYAGVTKKPSDVITWLEFVQVMQQLNSPASKISGSPNGESRSEDEAKGNTACDEAVDVFNAVEDAANNVDYYKKQDERTRQFIRNLMNLGYTIVRTSTLVNRNGCYNTRTDKDVD